MKTHLGNSRFQEEKKSVQKKKNGFYFLSSYDMETGTSILIRFRKNTFSAVSAAYTGFVRPVKLFSETARFLQKQIIVLLPTSVLCKPDGGVQKLSGAVFCKEDKS